MEIGISAAGGRAIDRFLSEWDQCGGFPPS
jgi:hypothetical protein